MVVSEVREGEVVVLTMEVEQDKEAIEKKKKGDVSHNGSDTI